MTERGTVAGSSGFGRPESLRIKLYHIWDNENEVETTIVYRGAIGIMENRMETTIVYGGTIGIMKGNIEATIIVGFRVPGFFLDLIGFCMF